MKSKYRALLADASKIPLDQVRKKVISNVKDARTILQNSKNAEKKLVEQLVDDKSMRAFSTICNLPLNVWKELGRKEDVYPEELKFKK
jgi:hypothetical protein